jgi:hypothetical protein
VTQGKAFARLELRPGPKSRSRLELGISMPAGVFAAGLDGLQPGLQVSHLLGFGESLGTVSGPELDDGG